MTSAKISSLSRRVMLKTSSVALLSSLAFSKAYALGMPKGADTPKLCMYMENLLDPPQRQGA